MHQSHFGELVRVVKSYHAITYRIGDQVEVLLKAIKDRKITGEQACALL